MPVVIEPTPQTKLNLWLSWSVSQGQNLCSEAQLMLVDYMPWLDCQKAIVQLANQGSIQ